MLTAISDPGAANSTPRNTSTVTSTDTTESRLLALHSCLTPTTTDQIRKALAITSSADHGAQYELDIQRRLDTLAMDQLLPDNSEFNKRLVALNEKRGKKDQIQVNNTFQQDHQALLASRRNEDVQLLKSGALLSVDQLLNMEIFPTMRGKDLAVLPSLASFKLPKNEVPDQQHQSTIQQPPVIVNQQQPAFIPPPQLPPQHSYPTRANQQYQQQQQQSAFNTSSRFHPVNSLVSNGALNPQFSRTSDNMDIDTDASNYVNNNNRGGNKNMRNKQAPNPNSAIVPQKRGFDANENYDDGQGEEVAKPSPFVTARQQMMTDINSKRNQGRAQPQSGSRNGYNSNNNNTNSNNNNNNSNSNNNANNNNGPGLTKRLGNTKRGLNSRFICPLKNDEEEDMKNDLGHYNMNGSRKKTNNNNNNSNGNRRNDDSSNNNNNNEPVDDRLKNIEPKMIEMINNEIMDSMPNIGWEDIAGLNHAKETIKESVIWPMLRPDIFTGLRGPPKGILFYGPPGTGKTLIGKCIASQSGATFFSISSSSLTSKYVGEGEKMVRALFAVARVHQPSVIFIDEIDSLLTQRTDGEFDATRRMKTEFLVQFDGCTTDSEDRILLIGATNRPHELDEAARRRFRKKLYIPLPDFEARSSIIKNLLKKQNHGLSPQDIEEICRRTDGYSGSDMDNLCREASLGPVRDVKDIRMIAAEDVRGISFEDFVIALTQVRASVSEKDLDMYVKFEQEFGSLGK